MRSLLAGLISRVLMPLERPLLAVARLLGSLGLRGERVVEVRGLRLTARTPDRILALLLTKWGLLEGGEDRLLRKELKPGQTALDIGANIGILTMELAGLVGLSGSVYAFEPDPENAELLEKTAELNGFSQVRVRRAAVSDKKGTARLFLNEDHRGDHRLYDSGDGREFREVEMIRLDDELKELDRLDFIKIDIQGYEAYALEGMKGLLSRFAGVRILCELCPSLLELAGSDPGRFLGEWRALGFVAHRIETDGSTTPATPEELLVEARTKGYINLLFKRD